MASRELTIVRRASALNALQEMLSIAPTRDAELNITIALEEALIALTGKAPAKSKEDGVHTMARGIMESDVEEVSQAFGVSEASVLKLRSKAQSILAE